MSDSKLFNDIYGKMVQSEDDILGHIAYSIYKKHKISVIQDICKNKGVDYALEEDLAPFINIANSKEQIEFYKEKSEKLTNIFLEKSFALQLSEEKKRLEYDFINSHKTHGFFYGACQSAVGSFLFLLIGYFLLLITGSWDKLLSYLQ